MFVSSAIRPVLLPTVKASVEHEAVKIRDNEEREDCGEQEAKNHRRRHRTPPLTAFAVDDPLEGAKIETDADLTAIRNNIARTSIWFRCAVFEAQIAQKSKKSRKLHLTDSICLCYTRIHKASDIRHRQTKTASRQQKRVVFGDQRFIEG